MARIAYANPSLPDIQPLVDRIVSERGSLLHLYQMLLHSAPLTEGWLVYLTAIRQRLSLAGAIRELVIIRVASLNGAQYEADQHAPIARREGVSEAKLAALGEWRDCQAFATDERAALALTDAMTRDVQVPGDVFDAVRAHFSERETVELVATIAAYNMVSRFLEALQIHSHDER
ncbi:MAG TPA: carboxymuconolactone decarboxylase family protein [Casimicrobiaceae bacterium]|nr:carboxymuconolactone decarboxylase family protein [Casimicrobiaceae bacterium]